VPEFIDHLGGHGHHAPARRKADPEELAQPALDIVEIDEGTPVSVKIRERIKAARKRFNANDNIADFIEPGELESCSTRSRSRCRACSTAW
jgi:hypothetical protein